MRPFNPELPSVNVCGSDGGVLRYNIRPTPRANREKLSKALEELLRHSETLGVRGHHHGKKWLLDEQGDAIHRHLAFHDESEAERFQSLLWAAADEVNHHPHITGTLNMTVTCTTHNPRGLSMRDVRLAQKVDELAHEYKLHEEEITMVEIDDSMSSVRARQKEQRQVNRHEIDKAVAKQTGACFTQQKEGGRS